MTVTYMAHREETINNVRVGYRENETKMCEIPMDKGMKHGLSLFYYPDGKNIECKINWVYDKKHGYESYYWQNGKLRRQFTWILGVRQGFDQYFNKEGELDCQFEWVAGRNMAITNPVWVPGSFN